MPYSIFKTFANQENHNKNIGLIQAAGTRMGGYFYAFYRLIKLRKALKRTISSDALESLKIANKPKKNKIGRSY